MATFTETLAALVVQSSVVAFSHFGVAVDVPQAERTKPVAERVVARTPRRAAAVKASDCPETPRTAPTVKA